MRTFIKTQETKGTLIKEMNMKIRTMREIGLHSSKTLLVNRQNKITLWKIVTDPRVVYQKLKTNTISLHHSSKITCTQRMIFLAKIFLVIEVIEGKVEVDHLLMIDRTISRKCQTNQLENKIQCHLLNIYHQAFLHTLRLHWVEF